MKRLRILFAILAVSLGISAASAQNVILDNPDNRAYFGLRGGLDIACPGDYKVSIIKLDLFKTGVGFHVGGIYNIPLWKNLYFEPGVSIYYNAIGYDVTGLDAEGIPNADIKASIRRFGFRVPFAFGYHFDFENFSLAVFTGPEINLGVIGRDHASFQGESESENAYGSDGLFNRFGLGWKFGAGVTVNRFVFELSGNVGMTDMAKGDAISFHDNAVYLTLGYNF